MRLNKKVRLKIAWLVWFSLAVVQLSAQTLSLRVVEADSSRPLPFVNILFDSQNRGTTTNIDGYFTVNAAEVDSIGLSYVGYNSMRLAISQLSDGAQVRMEQKNNWLDEIQVVPGDNPADAVMQRVVQNREIHRPRNLDSYQYQAYNKLTFMLSDETRERFFETAAGASDSSKQRLRELIDQQYLFLMESVSRKVYQKPQKEKEVVIASRVSGLEDPSFFLLATQLQSFTFYQDYIRLFEKEFLSPISQNSWNKYLFQLEETLNTPDGDSLFVIRFQPRKNRNFDGVKGVLTISSDGYAIESLRAEAAENTSRNVALSIEQVYDQLPTGEWFPKALNSEILFSGVNLPGSGLPAQAVKMKALGKSYLMNREVNVPIANQQLKGPSLSVDPSATRQPDDQWNKYRSVPLSQQDSSIYWFTDSLGQRINLDAKMKAVESMASWRFPVGKVDVLMDRLAGMNKFEGLQLGMALETNPRLSRTLRLGSYWRYGFSDDQAKYGGSIHYRVDSVSNTHVFATYENDVREDGVFDFLEQPKPFISQQLDDWFRRHFSYHETYQLGVEGRLFPSLLMQGFLKHYRLKDPTFVRLPLSSQPQDYMLIGGQLRMTFKERLFRKRGEIYSLGGRYPVLHLHYERSLKRWSDRPLRILEMKLSDSYRLRNLGEFEAIILASLRNSGGVANLLASPPASSSRLLSFYNDESFATMQANEFVADRFIALFWRHNFGSLLFKYRKLRPDISLAFNAGIGSTEYDGQVGFDERFLSPRKGYFEAGLLLSKLIRLGLFNFGGGAFYRLGAYQFDLFGDNLALKFTIDLAI